MVTTRQKKVTKYRGHTTHGGGHRKKRRGAGSRGGRGRAGSGKRAGQKVAGGLTNEGRNGFRPRRSSGSSKGINVSYFTSQKLDILVSKGLAEKKGDTFSVDLAKLGISKLLGTGSVGLKLKIQVESFTSRAAEKIKAAGGEVVNGVEKAQNQQPAEAAQAAE